MSNHQKTDPYLSEYKSIERLVKDYIRHGGWVVAYDYDSTVFDFHRRGDTFELVIKLLKECKPYARFIVYTHSNDDRHDSIKEYLDEHNIPWDKINEGIVFANGKREGKLFYSHFLDDRAGLKSAYFILDKALEIIKENPKDEEEACEMLRARFGNTFECE